MDVDNQNTRVLRKGCVVFQYEVLVEIGKCVGALKKDVHFKRYL